MSRETSVDRSQPIQTDDFEHESPPETGAKVKSGQHTPAAVTMALLGTGRARAGLGGRLGSKSSNLLRSTQLDSKRDMKRSASEWENFKESQKRKKEGDVSLVKTDDEGSDIEPKEIMRKKTTMKKTTAKEKGSTTSNENVRPTEKKEGSTSKKKEKEFAWSENGKSILDDLIGEEDEVVQETPMEQQDEVDNSVEIPPREVEANEKEESLLLDATIAEREEVTENDKVEESEDPIFNPEKSVIADISLDTGNELRPPIRSSTPKPVEIGVFDFDEHEREDNVVERRENLDVSTLPIRSSADSRTGRHPKKGKPTKRPPKRVIRDDMNSQEQQAVRDDVFQESELHTLLMKRQFGNLRANTAHISALITRQKSCIVDHYAKLRQQRDNARVSHVHDEMEKLTESANGRPSIAAKKKMDAKKAQKAQEIVQLIGASIDAITETPQAVHVNDIVWDEQLNEVNDKNVSLLMHDILTGRKNIMQLRIQGFRDLTEDDKEVVFIHRGAEVVSAYKKLATELSEIHPGEYVPLEDSALPRSTPNVRQSMSQPANSSGRQVRIDRSESQGEVSDDGLLDNPFAFVMVQVLDSNGSTIPNSNISLMKTLKSDEYEEKRTNNRVKMYYMKQILLTLGIKPEEMAQKFVNTQLKISMKYFNPTLARAVRLPRTIFDALVEVMQKNSVYELVSFVQLFTNARNISADTADSTLLKIKNNEITDPDDALKILKAHIEMVQYVLIGQNVRKEDAIVVDETLEQSRHNLTAIRGMVNVGMKLQPSTLRGISYKADPILDVIARELDPCVGFAQTLVVSRMRNNGSGRENCIVGFITSTDLKSAGGTFAFTDHLNKTDSPTYLFVVDHDGDSTHVTEHFRDLANLGAVTKQVDCLPYKKGDGSMADLVNCIIIGGMSGVGWTIEQLRERLVNLGIHSIIHNHILRRMMFNAFDPSARVAHANKLNSVFVHSPRSSAIMAIIANIATRRVILSTSNQREMDAFKNGLADLQKDRLKNGREFPPKRKKGNNEKGNEDDNEDDNTYEEGPAGDGGDAGAGGAEPEEEEDDEDD